MGDPSLKFFYLQALASDAPYNETHWKNSARNKRLYKAIGETDQAKAQGDWNQVQKNQYDQGGYINWINADWVDGLSTKVKGMKPIRPACSATSFMNAWLSA